MRGLNPLMFWGIRGGDSGPIKCNLVNYINIQSFNPLMIFKGFEGEKFLNFIVHDDTIYVLSTYFYLGIITDICYNCNKC